MVCRVIFDNRGNHILTYPQSFSLLRKLKNKIFKLILNLRRDIQTALHETERKTSSSLSSYIQEARITSLILPSSQKICSFFIIYINIYIVLVFQDRSHSTEFLHTVFKKLRVHSVTDKELYTSLRMTNIGNLLVGGDVLDIFYIRYNIIFRHLME